MHEHERIEELLAGYALRAVAAEDRAGANSVLAEHLPVCPSCRDLLAGFEDVAADVGLSLDPLRPPDLVRQRLRRELRSSPRRRRASAVAVAAGVAAMLGMGFLSMRTAERASLAEEQAGLFGEAVRAMSQIGTTAVPLRDGGRDDAQLVGVTGPHLQHLYLVGEGVPDPAPGNVYRLWLGGDGTFRLAAEFVPVEGIVALEIVADTAGLDTVLVTEEPAIAPPGDPGPMERWWSALPAEV